MFVLADDDEGLLDLGAGAVAPCGATVAKAAAAAVVFDDRSTPKFVTTSDIELGSSVLVLVATEDVDDQDVSDDEGVIPAVVDCSTDCAVGWFAVEMTSITVSELLADLAAQFSAWLGLASSTPFTDVDAASKDTCAARCFLGGGTGGSCGVGFAEESLTCSSFCGGFAVVVVAVVDCTDCGVAVQITVMGRSWSDKRLFPTAMHKFQRP